MLDRLKLDLALRTNNKCNGSGLGGNPAQFFFLLSHDVRVNPPSRVYSEEPFEMLNNEILYRDTGCNLVDLRKSFNKIFVQHPDKNSYTEENITDVNFLRNLDSNSSEVKLLIHALEKTKETASYLNDRFVAATPLFESFEKEYKAFKDQFLTEINIPINCTFSGTEWESLLAHYPIKRERFDDISSRRNQISQSLIGKYVAEEMNMIKDYPIYIQLFTMRTQIGITNLVRFNLNENPDISEILDRVNSALSPEKIKQ